MGAEDAEEKKEATDYVDSNFALSGRLAEAAIKGFRIFLNKKIISATSARGRLSLCSCDSWVLGPFDAP